MELTTDDRMRLTAGLSLAFQEFDRFALFIKDYCRQRIEDWTDRTVGMESVFAATIKRVERDHWMDELLAALVMHGPRTIASTAATLQVNLAARRPCLYDHTVDDPLGALFFADGECFIGRQKLRDGLRLLRRDSNKYSVLCVTGGRGSGKSYSYELLKLLDNLSEPDVVVRIDFKDFRKGDIAERYRNIVHAISSRLQIPFDKIPPPNETNARWFENAIITFDNIIRDRHQQLWLVFDHVAGKRGVEASILDALSSVAKYATIDSPRLRIVLIEMAHSKLLLERTSRERVETDIAAIPGEEDIAAFLHSVQQVANVQRDPGQIRAAVDEIVADLGKMAPEDAPWELSRLTWKQVKRLDLTGQRP